MSTNNGVPWITHRIQHPAANDIIVRDAGLPIPVAGTEIFEPYAIAFHGAASDHRRQASIVDTLLNVLLRQHLYRFIIPVGRVYRLPETQTDWIEVRRKLAASVAAIRIVSVVRSTDLVVSSSWDDGYVAITTPNSNAVLHKIVSIFGEEVESSSPSEARVEVLRRIAVEAAARFGCRFLLPRRCDSNSTVVYRILDPQCEQAQYFLSQSFADWPAAVVEQLDDTLLMLDTTTRAFLTAMNIQTTGALLRTSTEDVVRDLLDWRRQQDMKEWKISTAKIYVNRWKRMASNHQRNVDGGTDLDVFTHQRQPKIEVDLSSILLDPKIKAFLTAEGITRSSDLFRGPAEEIGRAFIGWRRQQNLAEITASDAKQYVYAWRRCVINHVPEDSNASASASFISNRADTRLLSSTSGNFIHVEPSQGRHLANCNGTERAIHPAMAIRRDNAAHLVGPTGLVLNKQGGGISVWDERNASNIDPRLNEQASQERIVATCEFEAPRCSLTTAVPPAPNTLNSATRERMLGEADQERMAASGQFAASTRNLVPQAPNALHSATLEISCVEGDQEQMAASGQFGLWSPSPYALHSENNDRSFAEADRERVVPPSHFVGPQRNLMPPVRYNYDLEILDRSIFQGDREQVVATGHFAAPPRNLMRPTPYALDWESHERSFVEADRKRVVAPSQFTAPSINTMTPARYTFDSETHDWSIVQADQERVVATCQIGAPPRNSMPPARNYFDSKTQRRSIFGADHRERVVATGQLVRSPKNPMPLASHALESETHHSFIVGSDRGRAFATGQFIGPPRNPMPAIHALESETHHRSIVRADRERAVATGQFVALSRNPTPPRRYGFDSETHHRSIVGADRERAVTTGQFVVSPKDLMPAPHALESESHHRSIVGAERELAVATGQFGARSRNPMPPTRYNFETETHHSSIVAADRERAVAICQIVAPSRPPAPHALESESHHRSPVNADQERVVAPGHIVTQPRKPMPPAPYALKLESHKFIAGADRERAVATGQLVAAPKNPMPPAPLVLDSEIHERSLIHADREGVVPPGQFAASARISTIKVPTAPNSSVSLIHGRSLVEADWERIVAAGPLVASTGKLNTAVPPTPNVLDSATYERSLVGADRELVVGTGPFSSMRRNLNLTTVHAVLNAMDSATLQKSLLGADRGLVVATTGEPHVLNTLDSATQEICSTSKSSTATDYAASSESAPSPSSSKTTLVSTSNNGGTASLRSAENSNVSASVSTLAADPLDILGATALSFLSTQGIVTGSGFCRQSTEALSQALSHWRQERGMKSLLAGSVERYVQMWKQSVRRELAKAMPRESPAHADNASCQQNDYSDVDIETSEDGLEQRENVLPRDGGRVQVEQLCASGQVAPSGQSPASTLDPGLCFLGSLAQAFLTSQGHTTTRLFIDGSTKKMAGGLVEYRRQKNLKEWTLNKAERHVSRWKREVQERQPYQEEVPVEADPSFEVFSSTVRSFLAAQSIANPSDFYLRSTQQLSEALVEWRRERNMKELKLRTAEQYVQRWRRSVAGYQAMTTGIAPPVSGVETSPDTKLHQGRSALSPLREKENSGRRMFFGGATNGQKVHIYVSGPTDNSVDGGCENADDSCEAWTTSSPHRMARSGRQRELEIDPALDILAVPAKAFLASRGITTAQSLLQSTNEALAHALVVYRRQQKVKEWTFSTAQRYVWNWKHLVKEQLSVDGGSAKIRPAGRPPLDCDWDATRGVWVPRSHREAHSIVARHSAVELTRRSNAVDQSSFKSASRRTVTFQDDAHEERLEEDNVESYGGANARLNYSKDPDERQVYPNSGKLGRNATERTLLAQRTGTVTAATVNLRQETGRDDSNTVDTDLYTCTNQSSGKDSDIERKGTSGKRSRSESAPNALERSPKRGWKVVASSVTSSPK
jgi:hypothetical protein